MRQQRPMLIQHLQSQLVPGTEPHLPGYSSLLAAFAVFGPLPRQVKPDIDQGMLQARDVAEVDANLAVIDLAEPAAPLASNTDRLSTLLGESGRIEDKHSI